MRIGVALRLVPDLSEDVELTEDETAIDLEWVDITLNEFDDHALEEAILLSETSSSEVVAMTLDVEGADRLLRTALARGAHRGVKIPVEDEDMAMDSRAIAPIFAAAAHELEIDLMLTGVQAPDDVFGPLTGYLGATLDWPFAGAIAGTQLEDGRIQARQEYSGGFSSDLSLELPAVLGIQAASKPMRYVSGTKMREMMKAELEVAEVGAAPAAGAASVLKLSEPERTEGAEMFEGDAKEIAARLKALFAERGLIDA